MRMALLSGLALAACSHAPPAELPPPDLPQRAGTDPIVAARAEGVNYIAHGDATPFELRFYADRILFSTPGVAAKVFPLTEPQHPVWYGEIYRTENENHDLYVTLRFDRPCPSGNGEHLVEVRLDRGEQMSGCGRRL